LLREKPLRVPLARQMQIHPGALKAHREALR